MKTVPLYGKVAAGRVALVDDADYDLVMQHRWNVQERTRPNGSKIGPYAFTSKRRNGRTTVIWMHKLLMPGVHQVDHKDGGGLNNQRSNLRPATNLQNHANQSKTRTNHGRSTSSRFKGVYWSRLERKWKAQIQTTGRKQGLGTFTDEDAAAMAYDAAAREAFGPFARLNFPAPVNGDM
jgi:hypothetical protein